MEHKLLQILIVIGDLKVLVEQVLAEQGLGNMEFKVYGIIANLANMENQQIDRDFWYPFKKF